MLGGTLPFYSPTNTTDALLLHHNEIVDLYYVLYPLCSPIIQLSTRYSILGRYD